MVNVEKLKEEMKKNKQTVRSIASVIGVNTSTLYRKLKGGCSSLTVGEVAKITDLLKLSPKKAKEIFFNS